LKKYLLTALDYISENIAIHCQINKLYKMKISHLISLLTLSFLFFACESTNTVKISEVKCQYAINPIGVDAQYPAFSWLVESKERGKNQKAFQILVSDNLKDLDRDEGNFWDSGKVNSDQSNAVFYDGAPLKSTQTYFWKVRVWDELGQASNYSETAQFTTSILDSELWQADWIGQGSGKDPANKEGYYEEKTVVDIFGDSVKYNGNSLLLRNKYRFSKPIEKAIVNICGLGLYELSINGKKVGDKILNPAKTNYNKIVLYDTYDVSEFLNNKENVFGIVLGNGWYNPVPKWWSWRMQWFGEKRAMLQMHVTLKDGTTQVFSTDTNWKMKEGPVRRSCIYEGETYDATKEMEGWDEPGFDDSAWANAKIVNPPKGKLTAQMMPAIQHIETLKPISITYPGDSLSLVDFGQNFSGWIRIKVKGERGDSIVFKYAEDMKDGMLDPTTNHRAVVIDTFISNGGKDEIYEPRFTYHGFQFTEISGLNYQLQAEYIEGIVVHSAVEPSGSFECSNEEINRIHTAILWSQRANLMGYPTDCPQREERLGWIGDAHVTAEEAIYNFDMNQFYTKWLKDIRINQDSNGDIPYIAPRPISNGDPAFSWSCGYHLITWYHYMYYGDKKILEENYRAMKKYVDYLSSLADAYIVPNDKYGDWVSPLEGWERGTPASISTGYYYYTTSIVAKAAEILGFTEDTKEYLSLSEKIKTAFNQRFYNEEKGQYEEGSQFSNSFALFLGVVPNNEKETVLNNLVNNIEEKHDIHLTTGILGTKYLMETLSQEGRSDVAWKLATQTTYPSWINMLEGRNTLSEHWGEGGMNSHNHVMMGSIDSWFYKTLAGIQVDEKAPGFKNMIIKPYMPADLSWVKASLKTVNGMVKSEWSKNGTNYNLKVEIPFGSDAVVYVLAGSNSQVMEGETLASEAENVTFLRMEGNYAVFQVASGEYNFDSSGL
jgi:alpha-L-rhamnosidase